MGIPTWPGADIIDVSQPTGLGDRDRAEGVPLDQVLPRLMSFLLHFAEARLWSYAWMQCAYPEAFAALLSDGKHAGDAFQSAKELWTAATDAEANQHLHPEAWDLRQEVYWLSWALVQFLLRWLAHVGFQPCPAIHAFLCRIFLRIGDTKCVEESHKIGRGLETKGQDPKKCDAAAFYARLQREKTPLSQRGIPHMQVCKSAAYQGASGDTLPDLGLKDWSQIHARQSLMHTPSMLAAYRDTVLNGNYPKHTPKNSRTSISAAQALVHLHREGLLFTNAKHAWQAVCCVPHTFIRNENQVLSWGLASDWFLSS